MRKFFFSAITKLWWMIWLLEAVLLAGCGEVVPTTPKVIKGSRGFDLPEIIKRGKLIALCRYDPNSYFIYKGRPMGYEYEMLGVLAEFLGIGLEIRVPKNWSDVFKLLEQGKGDVIGASLSVTLERLKAARFTNHFRTTRQMLVQQKPPGWHRLKIHQLEKHLLRNPIHLIHQPVYVLKDSPHHRRLLNLSEEIGGRIHIIDSPQDWSQAYLIKRVSEGTIKYTISDEEVAQGYAAYYRNVDAKTPVSFPQRIAWAVRKDAPELLKTINAWIAVQKETKSPRFNIIYNKYFKNRKAFVKRLSSDYLFHAKGKISPYDNLFKKYAKETGFDWKLLASIAFQESQFDPIIKSWMGAVGLMQVMPGTAKQYGVTYLENPADNVKAGAKYLADMRRFWDNIQPETENIKFSLASYNAGPGHVQDARRLAAKYGANPDIWTGNVAEYLRKKSQKQYYYDEVVKYGYCRGEEPFRYVQEVLARYSLYCKFEKDLMAKTAVD